MLYGEPRVTNGIDQIVFLQAKDIARLPVAFPSPQFHVPPAEVIAIEVARERRGHFNVICPDFALKADFYVAGGDELHAWAFRNMKQNSIGSTIVRVAPPEYVIVRKLEYFREGGSEKHLRDIRAMLAVSGDQINRPELEEWICRRGAETEWEKVIV